MARLAILNVKGDTGIRFSAEDFSAAAEKFDRLVKVEKALAFATKDGESRVIRSFDPEAEEIVIVRNMIGG